MATNFQTIPGIKRGDSLTLNWSLPLFFAELVSVVECQVNDSTGVEVIDLDVALVGDTDTHRVWTLSATALQTKTWPVKSLRFDIKHTAIDGKVVRTDTILLPVKQEQTP